jgi:hypothetical protein
MKRSVILICAILSIFVMSCKKSSNDTTTVPAADYYQLKVGNYWIYQAYKIDSNGVGIPQSYFDSAHIEKDTIIRGYTYYKFWQSPLALPGGQQLHSYVRDSSGFLVNNLGYRFCSVSDFTDTLVFDTANIPYFIGYGKMTGKDSAVTIPAGTFQSITIRLKVIPLKPEDSLPIRYSYDVYGKNVGKIKSHSFFYYGGEQFEARLVRFRVQ